MCQGRSSATLWSVPGIGHYEAVRREIVRLLREERLLKGLSNYAVSQKCGVSESMLSLVERGHRNPTMELMLRIADGIDANLPKLIRKATVTVENETKVSGSKVASRSLISKTGKSRH